ncbi:hypothetical protein [Ruminococcus sp.]|uniref:hypothetical protein n=1 Tax=Ruminococcus sp. TaxID=41978 RepID=UPI00258BBCA1|nr:hypothetical protein [Ruminococcus sp.]MCR5022348.1 hypothetical protein [Ruminococcus sp.]
MDLKRISIFGMLAVMMCFSLGSCGDKKVGEGKTKISTSVADKKSNKTDINAPDEPDPEALGKSLEFIEDSVDYSGQLKQINEQTDAFLNAVKAGDINAICDLLEPSSAYYKFFDRHRESAQLSKIMQTVFADMVWTHWAETDMNNKNWLQSAYSEHGVYTRSYVCAGIKEMLFYDEYFLLNFGKGDSVNAKFRIESEADSYEWIEKTLAMMPLLKNNWSIKCTLPDSKGKVLFNIDEDFIFDYTMLMSLDEVKDENMAQTYANNLADARGTIEDENATFDNSPELRENLAQMIKEKRFEDAWKSLKNLDDDGFFKDKKLYSDLDKDGRKRVKDYIAKHTYSVVCDHSTQVYDASRRRHIFTQIYYEAIPDDNEAEIADWLSENHIMEGGEAVFFDITNDNRLATALGGYFDIISKLG